MASWINRVLIAAPRNGTTDHALNPSSSTNAVGGTPFTPTAGTRLVLLAYGPATTGTPTGWTLPTNGAAVSDGGLYVWHRVAAGGDTVTVTHNASDVPIAFEFFEFAAGTTFVGCVQAGGVASAVANPNLTGLTGTNAVFGVTGFTIHADGATAPSIAWDSPNVEVNDFAVDKALGGTDGYCFGVATQDSYASASYQPTPTMTNMGGTSERLTFALNVAAAAPALDFNVRLSGGATNANPAASIGGAESSNAYTGTKTAGNLFDDSAFTEYNASGHIDYRCVYVHNNEASAGGTAVAYVSQQAPTGTVIAIGAATQAAGSTATAIANDATAPSGVTFSAPTSAGTGISLGTIGAGQGKGLWIRRTISAGATPNAANAWEISYEVTPL